WGAWRRRTSAAPVYCVRGGPAKGDASSLAARGERQPAEHAGGLGLAARALERALEPLVQPEEALDGAALRGAQRRCAAHELGIELAAVEEAVDGEHLGLDALAQPPTRAEHDRIERVAVGGERALDAAVVERARQRRDEIDRAVGAALGEGAAGGLD